MLNMILIPDLIMLNRQTVCVLNPLNWDMGVAI